MWISTFAGEHSTGGWTTHVEPKTHMKNLGPPRVMVGHISSTSHRLEWRHRILRPIEEPCILHINLHRRIVLVPHHLLHARRNRVSAFLSMIPLCRCPSDSSIPDELIVHGLSLAPSQSPKSGLVLRDSAPDPPPIDDLLLDQIAQAFS